MAEADLSGLAQQINRFSSAATSHLNTFRQTANEQNRSVSKMIKDVASHFTRQNGSLENISSALSDNAESTNNLSRKIDNNTGVLNQSVGMQSSMLGELQNINSTLGILIRVTKQIGNRGGGGTTDPNNPPPASLTDKFYRMMSNMFPVGGKVRRAANIAGASIGVLGAGAAGIGAFNAYKGETPLVANTTVAKDLPEGASALLDTIAGRESSGAYNVLNGGETFDISKGHPERRGAKGESTAAGRYQFTASTWKETTKKAGLDPKDFSPENQDRAAWHLAKEDYKRATKRNLEEDIKDPKLTGQILNNLKSWKYKSPGVEATPFSEKTFNANLQKEKARKENRESGGNSEQAKHTASIANQTPPPPVPVAPAVAPQAEQTQSEPTRAPAPSTVTPEAEGGNKQAAMPSSKPGVTERPGEEKMDEKQAKEFLQSRQVGGSNYVGVNAEKLNSDFAIKLAQAIKMTEKETGEGSIRITEGYRPPEVQAQYYANYRRRPDYPDPVNYQGKLYYPDPKSYGGIAAPPGQSNHQKGMAVDVAGGPAREVLRTKAARVGISNLGATDPPHFEIGGGDGESKRDDSGYTERPMTRPMGGYGMMMGGGMGIPMMGINPMMGRGGIGALGMGMMNPGMGMMMGGMGRTGGLIGLGANVLSSVFNRLSTQERPTAPARLVAPNIPQPSREIERAAVQDKVDDNSKRNQPPVVVQQGGGTQQSQQNPINDPSKRNKVTSASNPWAEELKEYYKHSLA